MSDLSAEIEQIKVRIRDLELSLVDYKEVDNKITKSLAEIQAEEKRLYDELKKQIEALQTTRQMFMESKRPNDQLIRDCTAQLNLLNAELGTLLSRLAAMEQISAVAQSVEELAKDLPAWELMSPYQKEDIIFTVHAFLTGKSGVLNANDMGMGKTAESAIVDYFLVKIFEQDKGRHPKVLWLTKKSLVKSSLKEIRKWQTDRLVVPIAGQPDMRKTMLEIALSNNCMVIANYDAVSSTPTLKAIEWDFVYIDEVHKLKGGANSKPTQLWLDAKDVVERTSFVNMMSGSPIMNHPKEMWAYLHLFDKHKFPTVSRFEREYCWGYGEAGFKVDFTKLITVLSGQAFRKTKAEVGMQLPPKVDDVRELEMGPAQCDVYQQMRTRFFLWLDQNAGKAITATAVIAQLTRLRQIASFPAGIKVEDKESGISWTVDCTESIKIDESMDLIEELVENGEQVVVFSSQFNEPLREVQRRCEKLGIRCDVLDGSAKESIDYYETRFQKKEVDVLAINMQTGSEGLNLQKNPDYWPGGSWQVIFLDKWYTPMQNEQAEARLIRRGQTDSVTVHHMTIPDSVDDFIQAIFDEKSAMISGIMESDQLRKGDDWKGWLDGMI